MLWQSYPMYIVHQGIISNVSAHKHSYDTIVY